MDVVVPIVSGASSIVRESVSTSSSGGCNFCGLCNNKAFLRVNQVVSVAILICSIATVILMSVHIAPMSSETYAFCIVLAFISLQNVFIIKRNIELSGYEKQNQLYKEQNDRFKLSIEALNQDVGSIRKASSEMESSLKLSNELNLRQKEHIKKMAADLDRFSVENSKLRESNQRYMSLLSQFENSLKTFSESGAALTRAEERFEESLKVSLEMLRQYKDNEEVLKDQVSKLTNVQKALQGTISTLTTSMDVAKAYIDKEEKLQREQETIVEQFKKLAQQEESFSVREAELLNRLDRDVRILEGVVKEKKDRCLALARRVLPLSLEVSRFEIMMEFIKNKNSELYKEASSMSRIERRKTFESLQVKIRGYN
jgi:hypothetical protein